MVTPLTFKLTCWPAAASKTSSAILSTVLIMTVLLSPMEMRPLTSTSTAALYGGTKRSPLLTVLPRGVARAILPDVAPEGTLAETLVAVAELGQERVMLNLSL